MIISSGSVITDVILLGRFTMMGSKQFDLISLFALTSIAGFLAFYFVDPTFLRFLIAQISLATVASIWGGLKFNQPIRYSIIAGCIWSLCVLLLSVAKIVLELELVRQDSLNTFFDDGGPRLFFDIVFIFVAISVFTSAIIGMLIGYAVRFTIQAAKSDRERRITIR
jgi:hypothetical protein